MEQVRNECHLAQCWSFLHTSKPGLLLPWHALITVGTGVRELEFYRSASKSSWEGDKMGEEAAEPSWPSWDGLGIPGGLALGHHERLLSRIILLGLVFRKPQ